ncbi:zinc finger BED domain-containing protein RICESLEEPER 2-like [Rhizophagus clarus]|uniref:Zinc finger BED domain-containing protein RICESLEEPER 2-like n=1 Tax=Rhizophagus clarus TaxID=94130 RepID=A0A8H3LPP2_9GLOM|nr:zinc finger BED domain-containing protein RICESLEEPER 2-like [Rhizophagus clarus]
MSVDLTKSIPPPTQRLGKRKAVRSKLFTKDLFEERNLPQGHEKEKTHREVECLNCPNKKVWYRKIEEGQSTLDEFMGQTEVPSKSIPSRISFALDAWTSINGYGFLAITVHWITKDWKLCDSLLDFIKLSGPHSGENICNAFVKSCDDFGILEKIFAITSDNTTNNDTFMKYLENTSVQDILKQIKAGEAETEDVILEMSINTGEVIPKLRKLIALDTITRSDKELQNLNFLKMNGIELMSDIVIAVKAGIEKLESYYAKTDDTTMYTVATVLDPRLKLGYYENHKWK